MQYDKLSLSNICQGAVEEVFQREMELVMKNVLDPNTNPEAVRGLTLEFKIKPFKDRSGAQVELLCKSKVPGADTVKGTVFLQRTGTGVAAFANDPRQSRLFEPSVPAAAPDDPDKKKVQ